MNYTIPNNKRELKPTEEDILFWMYYTIPNNKRELKPHGELSKRCDNYTIPNNKRELKHRTVPYTSCLIIPYQTTKGN